LQPRVAAAHREATVGHNTRIGETADGRAAWPCGLRLA